MKSMHPELTRLAYSALYDIMATIIGKTFDKRMREPGTTTLNEFCRLVHAGRLNDQEVVEIIRNQEELI